MADQTNALEIDKLLRELGDLHGRMQACTKAERDAAGERRDLARQVEYVNRRITVLRGERSGGRPKRGYGKHSFAWLVAEVLAGDPERTWTAEALAEHLDEGRHKVSCTLSLLVGSGRAKRVGRGVYCAGVEGPRPWPKKRKLDATLAKVLELLEGDPDRVWSTREIVEGVQDPVGVVTQALKALRETGRVQRLKRAAWTSEHSTAVVCPVKASTRARMEFRGRRLSQLPLPEPMGVPSKREKIDVRLE